MPILKPFVMDGFAVSELAAQLGMGSGRIGLMIAAFMLTMGLLCWPTVKLFAHFSARSLILSGSFCYGLLFAGIGWIPPAALPAWMALLGAASAVMFIPTLRLTALAAPDHARATVMGGLPRPARSGFYWVRLFPVFCTRHSRRS